MFEAKTAMTKNVITVKSDTHIIEAVKLLVKNEISGLAVVDDDNNLVGIFSEKDALKLLQNPSNTGVCVGEFMTKDVIHFDENDSLIEICKCMIKNPFRRVPITSGGKKLVGIISRHDIMKKILEMKRIKLEKSGLEGEDA